VLPPVDGDDWLGLTDASLPIGDFYEWCVLPGCGAVVLFSGTVRDHADGMVVPKLDEIAAETRTRWPDVGRLVLVHRVGSLELGESSVVAAVSAPHRTEAFAAARFAIDALKMSVPIWKREVWADGSDWGTRPNDLVAASDVQTDASTGASSAVRPPA
jgi:molybdopterin synthase catalytic subunit